MNARSKLLPVLGEAALAAKLWGSARGHLTKALSVAPSRRIYRLLAELETGEHDDAVAARNWLTKAEEAPNDPAWVCERCGTAATVWAALCRQCDGFDTLAWRSPADAPLPAATARVGAPVAALAPPATTAHQ